MFYYKFIGTYLLLSKHARCESRPVLRFLAGVMKLRTLKGEISEWIYRAFLLLFETAQ